MEERFLLFFCALNLISFTYCITEDVDDHITYDGLLKKYADRYENSLLAKKHGALHQLKFRGIDDEFEFQPIGNFLQNSSKCLADIIYTIENIKKPWAMKLFDSFGKPESGLLDGNVKWLGSYNECLNVTSINPNSSTIGNFRGKYCLASFDFKIQKTNIPLALSLGVCLPDSCSPEELKEDVMQLLKIAGTLPEMYGAELVSKFGSLQCKPRERPLSTAAICVIVLLSLFFALTLIGSSITVFKYFKTIIQGHKNTSLIETVADNRQLISDENDVPERKENQNIQLQSYRRTTGMPNELESFLNCFCVFTNGSKILNTNTSEGELLCIHGIRFLSMCWVILGHTYLFGITEMRNILALMEYVDTFLFQIVLQGFYSVDSFFVLSGFLVAYLAFNELSKTRDINWPYLYIHRYIRLTPIYMIILGFSATVYLYLGSGPYWPDQDVDPNCQKNWWQNLFYVNNFYDQSEQCMGWSWYLANDMQFFAISPLFLITLWKFPPVGYVFISIYLLACWLSNFCITYNFELMAGVFNISQAATASLAKFTEYFNKIYIKPYTRISPYLIGIVTGHLLHKRKEKNNPRHSLVFMCVGWALSAGIGLICVFVLYHQNPSLVGNSFYNAFNRMGFGLSLAWVIYACLVGQGGFVNQILSYKFFIPLSRLTYAAYLIHPMIIMGYFASMKTSMEFNHPTLVYLFLGFLVVTYALALPVALMLESPVIAIEKWFRTSLTKQTKTGTVRNQ